MQLDLWITRMRSARGIGRRHCRIVRYAKCAAGYVEVPGARFFRLRARSEDFDFVPVIIHGETSDAEACDSGERLSSDCQWRSQL